MRFNQLKIFYFMLFFFFLISVSCTLSSTSSSTQNEDKKSSVTFIIQWPGAGPGLTIDPASFDEVRIDLKDGYNNIMKTSSNAVGVPGTASTNTFSNLDNYSYHFTINALSNNSLGAPPRTMGWTSLVLDPGKGNDITVRYSLTGPVSNIDLPWQDTLMKRNIEKMIIATPYNSNQEVLLTKCGALLWQSDNPSLLVVNSNGKATPITDSGTPKIYISMQGVTNSIGCTLTGESPPNPNGWKPVTGTWSNSPSYPYYPRYEYVIDTDRIQQFIYNTNIFNWQLTNNWYSNTGYTISLSINAQAFVSTNGTAFIEFSIWSGSGTPHLFFNDKDTECTKN
jgi:hypothetical protein